MKVWNINNKQHTWITYLNPRNQKVKLQACAHCGVLEGTASRAISCNAKTDRVSNMLTQKGWVAQTAAAAA